MDHANLFVVQIAMLLMPGIIWARLDLRYAKISKPSDFQFIISAFVFGIAAYVVTFLIYALFGYEFLLIDFGDAETHAVISAKIGTEIASATLIGFALALVWVFASTHKWLSRFLQFIQATKRYGDEDVWDYTFNSTNKSVTYVNVRDFEKQLVYCGFVGAFSETGKVREIRLDDVEIFDFNGAFMFNIPRIYLARKPDDIHIEFPLTREVFSE